MTQTAEFRARYDGFIAGLALQEVRISSAAVEAPDPYAERFGALLADVVTETGYRSTDSRVVAWMTLTFEGRRAEQNDAVVRVRATVEVTYGVAEPMTDELFETFSQRNLPLNAWPYLREFLQSALARAGWPVYTLPAFKPAALQLQLELSPASLSAEAEI